MSFITFAWTTAALLAGAKTCTRRSWDPRYARQFKAGDVVDAYDRSPRNRGRVVAYIELLVDAYLESTELMPDSDWEAEGFRYLNEHPEVRPRHILGHAAAPDEFTFEGGFARWRASKDLMWVVRFRLLKVRADVRAIASDFHRQNPLPGGQADALLL
jgi:hypothetical protein